MSPAQSNLLKSGENASITYKNEFFKRPTVTMSNSKWFLPSKQH